VLAQYGYPFYSEQEEVRKQLSRAAERSVRPGSVLRRAVVGPVMHRLAVPGSVVVDVGGFDGSVSAPLSERACTIVLADVDVSGLARRDHAVTGVRASASFLPLRDSSADLVLLLDVLDALLGASPSEVYREARRVLKPGGRLVVTEVDAEFRLPFVDTATLFERLRACRGYDRCELEALLGEAGFAVGRYLGFYGVVTRLAYSIMTVHNLPRRGHRAKQRVWRWVVGLERRWRPRPQAHMFVARPVAPPLGATTPGGSAVGAGGKGESAPRGGA
jgi:ubiquinone/menaquinone biosynthesis C-methylase UbiE